MGSFLLIVSWRSFPPKIAVKSAGGYSEFQVMGMIEWSQKSRPKKIPRATSKTQKNPWTKN